MIKYRWFINMRLAVVQLSDIHFRVESNPVDSRAVPLAAAICSTDPTCTEYVILLTGDIAQGGQEDEYRLAQRFFNNLAKEMGRHHPTCTIRFLSIPGNHDCHLPEAEVQLREALVQAMQSTLQGTPDPSILQSLLNSQKHYFTFSQALTRSNIDQLCDCRIIDFGSHRVQFNLYNTALLSERKEKQGSLSFPMQIAKAVVTLQENCSLSISAFHHPYPWLESNVGLTFRNHIERTSDIVLTGHQHNDHSYAKARATGEKLFYSEGDVLQESNNPNQSGFRVMLFDLPDTTRRVVSYTWTPSRFTVHNDTGWEHYSRTTGFDSIAPTTPFLSRLSDSGIGLVHPVKGPIPLETVYVYPDAMTRKLDDPGKRAELSGSGLLQFLTEKSKLIIQGEASCGKTALARTAAISWLRDRVYYPLLLDGRDVKRADQSFLERIVFKAVRESYGEESLELYKQLPPSSKVLILDNWDDSPLGAEERDVFLTRADAYFGKLILLVEGISYLQAILAKLKGTEISLQFDHITLLQMSHVARGQLIDRWVSQDLGRDTAEFSRRVEETERLVNSVIGKNTLPSLPFIVLSLLQALEHKKDVLPENGSFGYLYEVLITTALSATLGPKPQLEKKYAFLSLLAYRLFETSMEVMSESGVVELLDDYSKSFLVKVDGPALLADLDFAHVLTKQDGNYSFVYPHLLQYFLARYFKDNLHGKGAPTLRKQLKEIVSGLNLESNRTFLMFVIYLTHDNELTDDLVAMGNDILSNVAPSDLTTEVDFFNKEPDSKGERPIPDSVDLDASRQHRREAADKARRDPASETNPESSLPAAGTPFSNSLPMELKFQYARSCLQILGQILKNFAGTLPGPRKLLILKTTYLLGLRILRALLQQMEDTSIKVQKDLSAAKKEQPKNGPLLRRVELLLTMMTQIIGVSVVRLISLSVGSADIEGEAYSMTLQDIGRNNATQLVDVSIKLDHSEAYPLKEITFLKKEYSLNKFASRVLRELVIDQMHVFKMTREMRQRVSSLLGVGSANPAGLLSKTNKRFRD
jgi:Calcineurin-like phosphoesterase